MATTLGAASDTLPELVSIRGADLLSLGKPFTEFPRYSILTLAPSTGETGPERSPTANFSEWLSRRLQIGHPFVIQDFEKLPQWDKGLFSIESLIELSTKKSENHILCRWVEPFFFNSMQADAGYRMSFIATTYGNEPGKSKRLKPWPY
jgi:hypothetical protein